MCRCSTRVFQVGATTGHGTWSDVEQESPVGTRTAADRVCEHPAEVALIGKARDRGDVGKRSIALRQEAAAHMYSDPARVLSDGSTDAPPELARQIYRVQIERRR